MKLDLKKKKLREINNTLQNLDLKKNERDFTIINPEGSHALCAGLNQEMKVLIKGHVGYYCAGMNQKAHIIIDGNVGTCSNISINYDVCFLIHTSTVITNMTFN